MSQILESDQAYARRMAGKRLLGGLLMGAGGIVAFLCGLCTLFFSIRLDKSPALLILPLILGGAPAVLGIVMFVAGLSLFRNGLKRRGQPERDSIDGGGSE